MRGLKVRGLAAPFNSENDYGETILPGAFDGFLRELGNRPLDMGLEHSQKAGLWTRLWTDAKGLWAEGFITSPAALVAVNSVPLRELSVTYHNNAWPPQLTRERAYSLGYSRGPRGYSVVPSILIRDAGLTEISLTERGAFRGTSLEVLGPETFTPTDAPFLRRLAA